MTVGEEVSNRGSTTTVAALIFAWSAGLVSLKSGFGGLVSSGVGEKVGFCVGLFVGLFVCGCTLPRSPCCVQKCLPLVSHVAVSDTAPHIQTKSNAQRPTAGELLVVSDGWGGGRYAGLLL